MPNRTILLIIGGGIAAYKSLELIRLLKKRGDQVRVILTRGGAQFVTKLSAATLAGEKVMSDLFDLTDETEIGHIKLARDNDLILVAPATADLMAKMAHGLADDLASTCLLARNGPVMVAPAMNPVMWQAAPTKRNVAQLRADGVHVAGPASGEMACGEEGEGRMLEAAELLVEIDSVLASDAERPLSGKHVLVTAGPTHEPIDPVRYIANRSSGLQGYAIAQAAAELGAFVTLVSGPTKLEPPAQVNRVEVETARDMLSAVNEALPADIAVCAAAVADWRVDNAGREKIKKSGDGLPKLRFVENPDILKTLAAKGPMRPQLVIGFAAETEDLLPNAQTKLAHKGCDWIIANDVSPQSGTFGGQRNKVFVVTSDGVDEWPERDKKQVARQLMQGAARVLSDHASRKAAAE